MLEVDPNSFNTLDHMNDSTLSAHTQYEIPDIPYEETMFKNLANDIKSTQEITNEQLLLLINETRTSAKTSFRLAVASIVVSAATLIVTFVGVCFQLFD